MSDYPELPTIEEMTATPGGINAPLDESGDRWLFKFIRIFIENNVEFNDLDFIRSVFAGAGVDFTVTNANGECALTQVFKSGETCDASYCAAISLVDACKICPQDVWGISPLMAFVQSRMRDNSRTVFVEEFWNKRGWANMIMDTLWVCDRTLYDTTGRNCLWYAWFHYYRINGGLPESPTGILKQLLKKPVAAGQLRLNIDHENIYGESFLHEVVVGFREPQNPDGVWDRWYPDELKAWRYRLVKQLINWGATVTQAMIDQCTDERVRQVLTAHV